jgi:ubiquinone/menaquinone biosynthesis C-methylase UbiE
MRAPKQKRDWNELAELDPMWAVLSERDRQFGQWSSEEFFATGAEEVSDLTATLLELGFSQKLGNALDFGCGLGRLTRALPRLCGDVVGVDISEAMLERARSLNPDCQFIFNPYPDLRLFPDDRFELVYSRRVLQHQHSISAILDYVSEFVRVLKPGGVAAFQIPSHIPLLHRIQPRRRTYRALRAIGVAPQKLYRWKLHPICMTAVPVQAVSAAVEEAHGRIMLVKSDDSCPGIVSKFYFVSKLPYKSRPVPQGTY